MGLPSPETTNDQARGAECSAEVRQRLYSLRVIINNSISVIPSSLLGTTSNKYNTLVKTVWSSLESHLVFLHVQQSCLYSRESPGGGDHLNLHGLA